MEIHRQLARFLPTEVGRGFWDNPYIQIEIKINL